eukprot:1138698-Pelagomonas_calceolata.AAC.4
MFSSLHAAAQQSSLFVELEAQAWLQALSASLLADLIEFLRRNILNRETHAPIFTDWVRCTPAMLRELSNLPDCCEPQAKHHRQAAAHQHSL